MLLEHLFVLRVNVLVFFSSPWSRGLAAVCDFGIPWTFLFFFVGSWYSVTSFRPAWINTRNSRRRRFAFVDIGNGRGRGNRTSLWLVLLSSLILIAKLSQQPATYLYNVPPTCRAYIYILIILSHKASLNQLFYCQRQFIIHVSLCTTKPKT